MGMNNSSLAYAQEYSVQRQLYVLEEQKVEARANTRRASVVKLALTVSFVFVGLFAMTFMSAQNYSLGVELNAVKSQIADTHTMAARAQMELGELSSLQRIENYAMTNLGMVYPAANDVYFLGEESSRILAAAIGGQEEVLVAEAEATAEQSAWDKLVSAVAGFFRGEASAAVE